MENIKTNSGRNQEQKNFHLLSYTKPYRLYFILAVCFILLECGLEISVPYLSNLLLKNGLEQTLNEEGTAVIGYTMDKGYVFSIALVMIGFALVAMALGFFTAKFTAKVGRGLGYELRQEEYRKILDFSFTNLDDFRLNSLVTRMTNDVQIISDTFCQVLRPLLRAPFQLTFCVVFALLMSRQLSIVFAVTVPLLAILLGTVLLLSRPLFAKLQTSLDHVNRTTQESLVAMKLIRSNAKKDYEIEKFASVDKEAKDIGNRALGINATNMAAIQLMTYLSVLGILFFGGRFAITNKDAVMIINMSSFLDYVMQMMASLTMLSGVFMSFTRAQASSLRLREVFTARSEILDKKDSSLKVRNGSVKFENVSFKYKKEAKENVLSDISFFAKDGEFLGIVGETGSSKSTLVSLIDRFYDPNEGKILIGGNDIKNYSLYSLRDKIAISFQSARLFSGTVRDNLKWGNPDASEEDIEEACNIACCSDFIKNQLPNGLDTMLGQTGSNVSGGQRQRLCIARAVLKKPEILILDDSFSALDRLTEAALKENLRTRLPRMTLIVISQKVSTIEKADHILVLKDGKIHGYGTSDELRESDSIYHEIYEIQKEGSR